MTNQPEPLDLDAIEARAGGLYEYATGLDTAWQEEADRLAGTDVPALVAEIRRLRAASEPAGAPVTAEQPAGVPESHPDRHSASQAPLRAPDGADIAAADNPTPLRWGLGDVLWGDDDTVTVLLSGPGGEPYWLELDQERAAVLREDLAGPDTEETHDDSAGLENGHGDTAIRLDDGSTHTHTAITNAGEACLMHACRAALEETRLRQEQYTLRAKIDGVLDEVDDLAADGDIPARAADRLRLLLRDALGLNTGT
jgi:hypothetical protein